MSQKKSKPYKPLTPPATMGRKKWRCTSCSKVLPESQLGWGLIWDSGDTGLCAKCLYHIRKDGGYFKQPKEKRKKAPKTRKVISASKKGLERLSHSYTLAKIVSERLKIKGKVVRYGNTYNFYQDGVSVRTRVAPNKDVLRVQQKEKDEDWVGGKSHILMKDVLFNFFSPHVSDHDNLRSEIEAVISEHESDMSSTGGYDEQKWQELD